MLRVRAGASGIGTSSSDFIGVEIWERDETFRSGVGAAAFGSFFLCERLPVLVRLGVEVPEAERTAGVAGIAGWEDVEREEDSAVRASKSLR